MIISKYSNSQIINIFNRILLFSLFIFFSCSSNELRQQLSLQEMEIQIEKDSFPKTTSILISQRGKMVYERYFGDGKLELLNDTRSVSL